MNRRSAIHLLGGAVATAAMPLNFGCGGGEAFVRDSGYLPTPQAPLTPTDRFYVNFCCGQPESPSRQKYRLFLRGLFDHERTLTFDDLLALPQVTREVTLECVGNRPGGGLISSAAFGGVRLRDALALGGLSDRAHGLQCQGLDGYASNLPRAAAEGEDALLVHTMNGEPLPPLHGAPLRVLFPDRYGMFSAKWLDAIVATRRNAPFGAFRGLSSSVEGTKPVVSRVDLPRDGATATVGVEVELRGLAVTPGTGVERVEVRIDDVWQPAELTFNTLTDDRGPFLWSLWRLRWAPTRAGRHVISVRAFDAHGHTQNERAEFPYDSGAVHSVRVFVDDAAAG